MEKKRSTAYVCNECGSDYSKWQGQCSDCGAWNSLSEMRMPRAGGKPAGREGYAGAQSEIRLLQDIDL